MSMRARMSRVLSTIFTSHTLRDFRRSRARRKRGAVAEVHYFHQAADPYSHLAAQCLSRLQAKYAIDVIPHIVPPPDDQAAPERTRLNIYALRDAARVARRFGLHFPEGAEAPNPKIVSRANAQLALAVATGTFTADSVPIGDALWKGETALRESADETVTARQLDEGHALRARLGHYLGGMFHFEGEWYWGVDRLHHLESRLAFEKLVQTPDTPLIAPYQKEMLDGPRAKGPPLIEFWFSFRSPYSYIAAQRVHRMAFHYGATVEWRFILPMIMRGLPVPAPKSRYITLDVKREADMLGIRYGTMVDPRGEGIHRALAVLHRAIQLGKGAEYAESGLAAAFADGIDMSTDSGLWRTAQRAGLTKADVAAALADESWRPIAEKNRQALFDAGLWGAPTYRINGGPAHWGQDRLWALEEDLKAAIAAQR